MPSSRVSRSVAAVSLAATAAVAAWGFWIDPDPPWRWFFLGGFLPALWAYVEFAQVPGDDAEVGAAIMAFHRYSLAFAGFMLTTRIGLRLMVHEGFVDQSWLATGHRFSGLILGIGMMLFGNFLPTLRSPWPFRAQPFAWQQVHRFVGWIFVLGGLGVIGSWAFLPVHSANRYSVLIVAAVSSFALIRKFASLTTRPSRP